MQQKIKHKYLLITLLQAILLSSAFSQTDTLTISSEIGLRGRWQTGNLNQLALNPTAHLLFSKKAFQAEVKGIYQFLRVEGFTIISDFWINGMVQLVPHKRIYPLITTNYGFAKSYKIGHSLLVGGGLGINLYQKSPRSFLQVNAFAGYMDLQFENEPRLSAPSLGTLLKAAVPIADRIHLSWELQTYHPDFNREYWGANNIVRLHFQVVKNLSLTASHHTIFNNKAITGIQKTNTLMLFGLQFQHNHH